MLCIMLCSHALSQQKAFWLLPGIKMSLCCSCVCFRESFSIQQPLPPPSIISLFQVMLSQRFCCIQMFWLKCLGLFWILVGLFQLNLLKYCWHNSEGRNVTGCNGMGSRTGFLPNTVWLHVSWIWALVLQHPLPISVSSQARAAIVPLWGDTGQAAPLSSVQSWATQFKTDIEAIGVSRAGQHNW